jgi:hypothetical protein
MAFAVLESIASRVSGCGRQRSDRDRLMAWNLRVPYRLVADQNRGLLTQLAPVEESIVDELFAERREDAEDESTE